MRKATERKRARAAQKRHRQRSSSRSGRRRDYNDEDDEVEGEEVQIAHPVALLGQDALSMPGQGGTDEHGHAHVRFASAPPSSHGAEGIIEGQNRYAHRSSGQHRPTQSRSRSASFLGELPKWMPGSGTGRQRNSSFSESVAHLSNSVRDRLAASVPDGKLSRLRFW